MDSMARLGQLFVSAAIGIPVLMLSTNGGKATQNAMNCIGNQFA